MNVSGRAAVGLFLVGRNVWLGEQGRKGETAGSTPVRQMVCQCSAGPLQQDTGIQGGVIGMFG